MVHLVQEADLRGRRRRLLVSQARRQRPGSVAEYVRVFDPHAPMNRISLSLRMTEV